MKTKRCILSTIGLCLGLAIILAFVSGCATNPGNSQSMKPMISSEHDMMSE